jgi:hypothetical protein
VKVDMGGTPMTVIVTFKDPVREVTFHDVLFTEVTDGRLFRISTDETDISFNIDFIWSIEEKEEEENEEEENEETTEEA